MFFLTARFIYLIKLLYHNRKKMQVFTSFPLILLLQPSLSPDA